jgi:hypothetical protein
VTSEELVEAMHVVFLACGEEMEWQVCVAHVDVCSRMLTYAMHAVFLACGEEIEWQVRRRMLTYADVC